MDNDRLIISANPRKNTGTSPGVRNESLMDFLKMASSAGDMEDQMGIDLESQDHRRLHKCLTRMRLPSGARFHSFIQFAEFFCVVLSAYKFLPLPFPTIQLKSPWKPPFHFHQRKSNLIWNVTYSRHTWHFKDVMPGTLMKTWLWKPVNVVLNHLSVAEHYSHTMKPTALFTVSCLTIFLDKTI